MAYHELIINYQSHQQAELHILSGLCYVTLGQQKLTAYNDPPVIVFELDGLCDHRWIIHVCQTELG